MGTPSPLTTNRPSKRWRTDAIFEFVPNKKDNFPKYHIIHCESTEKKARSISPFLVSKCLIETLGAGYKATKTASGDLLLEVKDNAQYQRLHKLTAFGDQPITITPHRTMNTVKGVVSDGDLMDLSDDELLTGWKEENVIQVQRIKIRRENKEIPTKHIILTFASSTLPTEIATGYLKLPVRPYIPNPRRCFKCQRFGHGSQSCRGQLTCAKCGTKGHTADDDCQLQVHCANCEGDHPAYSRSCVAWKMEKEIINTKFKLNISFREARQRVSPHFAGNTSYAEVVRGGSAPLRFSAMPWTTPSVPRQTPQAPMGGAASAAPPSLNTAPPKAPVNLGSSQGTTQTKEVPSTSSPVGFKAPSVTTKPTTKTLSVASPEAMDTSTAPAQTAPKERRGSLDRSKKDKTVITGPSKGSVR